MVGVAKDRLVSLKAVMMKETPWLQLVQGHSVSSPGLSTGPVVVRYEARPQLWSIWTPIYQRQRENAILATFCLCFRLETSVLGFHIIPWEEILRRLCSNIFCVLGPVIAQ